MEFHISRQARERYKFDQSLFTLSGNIIFANFHGARTFAQKMNQKRDLVNYPEQGVKAGQINAMGLMDEILHYISALYRRQLAPKAINDALAYLDDEIGVDEVNKTLRLFINEFPPLAVYQREQTMDEYFSGSSDGISNREAALEEMLMLWLENLNPAYAPYRELFDDSNLVISGTYHKTMKCLYAFLESQPHFGPQQQNLIDMLRSPAIAVPHSISGQLEYIRTHWADLLGAYFYRLLISLDLIREEEKLHFPGSGTVPVPTYDLSAMDADLERFSTDKEWMPSLVLIAKNTYVWLDQLSKKYQRSITHLDQIPDEELDTLAAWGISGLWFIGIWERSPASAQIKQLCGNPEAISSAYSLSSYSIAHDLGGEEAFYRFRERAWHRGIRLGSDMVPNHMGIDSPWVIEHPDWFVSLDYSPYPGYSYNGANLSSDPRISIYIEDHYYDRSDAAVTFKRVNNSNGQTHYLYHGNDGTSMPWNDTAQLNYLKAEVREAVIQTILSVARKFPIIRFDAAMTLAKRHYQRLWFPEPGSGGDIPSRSEHGLTRQQFDQLIPQEFWREVVDRAAIETPDTLLLAEAFWLMESYFVRTLGMHRVYNSAFMNMLRSEENSKYRAVIKNTLEFDPQILKRFVNFMNNPDERTAVDQFDKGDKYFGICILMITLPGLPMFGHGQIEGYTEKYGMEYRRAYWDETPDWHLVERHKREIFPLLHRRRLFAGVDNFLLYDFYSASGKVDENVYAYSNGVGNERALVVYHNCFATSEGWIRISVGFAVKTASGERQIIQRNLADGLNIQAAHNRFVIMRDHISGLEYIRHSEEIAQKGLFLHLNAFEYHVFLDFRQVEDDGWQTYHHLCDYLGGHGVPSIEEALRQLLLQPVLQPFKDIANPGYFNYLLEVQGSNLERQSSAINTSENQELLKPLIDEAAGKMWRLLEGITTLTGNDQNKTDVVSELRARLENLLLLPQKVQAYGRGKRSSAAFKFMRSGLTMPTFKTRWLTLFGFCFVHNLGKVVTNENFENQSQSWIDEWQLGKITGQAYQNMAINEADSTRMVNTIQLLTGLQHWFEKGKEQSLYTMLQEWLARDDVRLFLGINRFQGILWYNAEAFNEFIWWLATLAYLQISSNTQLSVSQKTEQILAYDEVIRQLSAAGKNSGFQVSNLLELTFCK